MTQMTPDFQTAAIRATETLIRYNVTSAPVDPLPILRSIPNVLVVSYETLSNEMGMDRRCVIDMFGDRNHDAFTSVNLIDGKPQYLVTVNQLLPAYLFQRALARELGHIILGHDGSRPEDVRNEEARTFARHLLCPRPLIHSLQAAGIRLTMDVFVNITSCNNYCLSCMRKQPAVHVPPELNRQVRDQFRPYILNFFEYQRHAGLKDGSALADFGTYMDGYEE